MRDLDLAVLEAPGTLVHVQDGTGYGLPCLDESEGERDRPFAEQALSGADDHGKLPDAQSVDEIALEQGVNDASAPSAG